MIEEPYIYETMNEPFSKVKKYRIRYDDGLARWVGRIPYGSWIVCNSWEDAASRLLTHYNMNKKRYESNLRRR
jgi:hypothetical protein